MLLSKTIRLFLDSIGRRDEYEFYLRKFQNEPGTIFALIVPDLASIEQAREVMSFDLNFLYKLELEPLLVLCGPDAPRMRELLESGPDRYHFFEKTVDPDVLDRTTIPSVLYAPRVKPDTMLARLVPRLCRRVHFIRMAGSLRDTAGNIVWYHYANHRRGPALHKQDRGVARQAARVIRSCPTAHVSVASPLNVLKEMFTVRGAGTVVRTGSEIRHHAGMEPGMADGVDEARLMALLNDSFGKRLKSRASLRRAAHIHVESNYRGAALLEKHPAGLYLSKFAVTREARGEGLAQELWDTACKPARALFWRSRSNNPINQWYERQADGRHHAGHWTIFWRGINPSHIPGIIRYCLRRKPDFVEPRGG
jgi:GNAT superfamily N-acetyltransferase